MTLRGARIAVSNGRRLLLTASRGSGTFRSTNAGRLWLGGSSNHAAASLRSMDTFLTLCPLSTTASTADSSSSASSSKKSKADDSNIFLDNLGKIFMGSIAAVILAIVRSSKGRNNRISVRTRLEEEAALDPLEIDDLRVANSDLTPDVFEIIMQDVKQAFPTGTATYSDFVKEVRRTMMRLKGEAFTVELGHLLDRAVMAAAKERGTLPEEDLPLAFHLTALSLAMNSPVPERMQTLYKVMEQTSNDGQVVRLGNVVDMVGYLQDTCQLIPDAQVVEAETKYPIQQYKKGKPEELVQWEGTELDVIDLEGFASILCTRSVCAWGECHNRKLKVAK